MYNLDPTKEFAKSLKKFSNNEQRIVATKLNLLKQNPHHPSLRTKKIQGLKDVFECSVNMDIRILWKYAGNRLILLINIGHHDII